MQAKPFVTKDGLENCATEIRRRNDDGTTTALKEIASWEATTK